MVDIAVWPSVWLLIRNTVRHWLLFVSGALASLAGWILQAQGTNLPTDYFLYAGGALMVMAFVRAWHELRVERDRLLDDRSPKFEIVFMPANDEESRPFLQVLAFQQQVPLVAVGAGIAAMRSPIGYARRDFVDRRYRVGIVNLSSATVPSVSLTLASCDPGGTYVHIGHHLVVMDSDPPVAARDLTPNTDGKPTLFFDVVNEVGPQGETPASLRFCYQNPNIVGDVAAGSYEIELRADGGNVSATRRFRVRKSWSPTAGPGRLTMEPM